MSKKLKPFPYTFDPGEIPTEKLTEVGGADGGYCPTYYQCPDACWAEHHASWCWACRNPETKKLAPHPTSAGHCMFERPADYGMVPYGCTDPVLIRAAHEHCVRSMLRGWDRDLSAEQLDRIVNATVDAKMRGVEVGASPFVACIFAGL